MADYMQIVDAVRSIEREQKPSIDISLILREHRCMQWLKKGYQKQLSTQNFVLNTYKISKSFRACADFFQDLSVVPYAIIKGAVLSKIAYGDEYLRKSGDIDILISRSQTNIVKEILLRHGFVQGYLKDNKIYPYERKNIVFYDVYTHQTAPFIKKIQDTPELFVVLDINFDVFWGESERTIDMDVFLNNIEGIEISGVQCNTLKPAYAFVALCMHHYKDMNSLYLLAEHGMRMDQLCDILYFIKSTKIDVFDVIEIASSLDVLEYIHFCVFYAYKLCAHPALWDFLRALDSVIKCDLTPFFGLSEAERQKWSFAFEERLFAPDFKAKFTASLSTQKKNKLTINGMFV